MAFVNIDNLNTGTLIDWDSVIENLPKERAHVTDGKQMAHAHLTGKQPEHYRTDLEIHLENELIEEFKGCNYHVDSIQWVNYYRSVLTDTKFIDTFSSIVGCEDLESYVSIVYPGTSAPKHIDFCYIDKFRGDYNLRRFMCFISEPDFGQVLFVKDKCYHNQPKGSIIEWDHYLDFHAAVNVGFKPFYLFTSVGRPYEDN